MVNINGVSIEIDLGIKSAMGKIETLRQELNTLDDTINIDVNVNRDQFDKLRDDLDDIGINPTVDSDSSGDGGGGDSDSDSTFDRDKSKGFFSPTPILPDKSDDDRFIPSSPKDASLNFGPTEGDIKDIIRNKDLTVDKPNIVKGLEPLGHSRSGGIEGVVKAPEVDSKKIGQSIDVGDLQRGEGSRFRAPRRGIDTDASFKDSLDMDRGRKKGGVNIAKSVTSLLPTSMRDWSRVMALMLPLLISMAGAIAGVASAFIGAAGAGAALMGLGLIGHGEDMGEAFSNAKKQIKELGTELFNVMQNPAKKFAPIQERIFDMIPGEMTQVAESMEGLTVFEGLVSTGIRGLIGWFAALVDMIVKNEEAITRVATKFGNILGHGIIDFLSFFIQEADNSSNALITFGHALKTILLIIYNLSKAFSGILVALQPVFDLVLWFAQLLNNKLVMSIVSTITVFVVLMGVLVKVNALMLAFSSGAILTGIFNVIYAVGGLIKFLLGAVGAASQLAVALGTVAALTGAGILAVAAGSYTYDKMSSKMGVGDSESFSGPAGVGSRSTKVINNNNINIEGDADRGQVEKMRDVYDKESRADGAMDR